MCIGNTTSPAASNTNYINWRDDEWERPEVIGGTKEASRGPNESAASANKKRDNLKAGGKQSSKTTGGTY